LFVVIGLAAAGIGGLLHRDGWEPTWERWGMVSRSPFFSDLRTVTGAMDSIDQGYDPTVVNPGSPWNQQFNQPQLWLHLMGLFHVREYDSPIIGCGLIVATLVALWWTTAGISVPVAIYFAVIFFSPVTMLAFERGNLDLMMFFLLAVAHRLANRSAVAGLIVVFGAFLLKLFPLAGLLLLLRETRERALRLGGVAVIGAAVYAAVTIGDLRKIWEATEKGSAVSYGYNVLWHYLRLHESAWTGLAQGAAYALMFCSLVAAWWRAIRPSETPDPVIAASRHLDGYRLGAGVYAGTFLLGNSWDYRLIFFFFAVPQLCDWLKLGTKPERWNAAWQLFAFTVAMYAMWLTQNLGRSSSGFVLMRGLEELAKWSLFTGCLWQLARTLPTWVRELLGGKFHPATPVTRPH
jgi:hypothetical protein